MVQVPPCGIASRRAFRQAQDEGAQGLLGHGNPSPFQRAQMEHDLPIRLVLEHRAQEPAACVRTPVPAPASSGPLQERFGTAGGKTSPPGSRPPGRAWPEPRFALLHRARRPGISAQPRAAISALFTSWARPAARWQAKLTLFRAAAGADWLARLGKDDTNAGLVRCRKYFDAAALSFRAAMWTRDKPSPRRYGLVVKKGNAARLAALSGKGPSLVTQNSSPVLSAVANHVEPGRRGGCLAGVGEELPPVWCASSHWAVAARVHRGGSLRIPRARKPDVWPG